MKKVRNRIRGVSCVILVIGMIVWAGCATNRELETRSLNRFIEDGYYKNTLKGYTLKWPPNHIWKYQNYPEFDLSFDHVDGKCQVFIIGLRGLIRRDFPEGFQEWLLDRLQARDITYDLHDEISTDNREEFRIVLNCRFLIKPREAFGVERRVAMRLFRSEPFWLAFIFIAPKEDFSTYLPDAEDLVQNLTFISE